MGIRELLAGVVRGKLGGLVERLTSTEAKKVARASDGLTDLRNAPGAPPNPYAVPDSTKQLAMRNLTGFQVYDEGQELLGRLTGWYLSAEGQSAHATVNFIDKYRYKAGHRVRFSVAWRVSPESGEVARVVYMTHFQEGERPNVYRYPPRVLSGVSPEDLKVVFGGGSRFINFGTKGAIDAFEGSRRTMDSGLLTPLFGKWWFAI